MTAPVHGWHHNTRVEVLMRMPPHQGRARYLVLDPDPAGNQEETVYASELILDTPSRHADDSHTEPTKIDGLLMVAFTLTVGLLLLGILLEIGLRLDWWSLQ